MLHRLCPENKEKAMRTKLKIKLVIVLSLSILLNVFLLWEWQRKEKILKKEISVLKEKLSTSSTQ